MIAPAARARSREAHAFNVDTVREGQLSRIGTEDLDRELFSKSKTKEDPEGAFAWPCRARPRTN